MKLAGQHATDCPGGENAWNEQRESGDSSEDCRFPVEEPHGEEPPVDQHCPWQDSEHRAEEARHIRPKEKRLRHMGEDVEEE